MSDDDIRALMLAHGFTIKEGHDDLKPYVYSAARAVERAARAAAFREAADICMLFDATHPHGLADEFQRIAARAEGGA